ncbi:glycosyltransferase family 4 protein [Nitrosospira briensis]|uniref:glycosyltransferase family 4 protein n=1 Tax=Nitrosospira briensis TaxID=35799 RepID=UPI0008E8472D|nr:glycosyltransferase family 4 protein [Nitrosospira briensis]SFO19275.1 Glycosyltransferase involved in cell wall bisynthesis [Nitrosospira briensis]
MYSNHDVEKERPLNSLRVMMVGLRGCPGVQGGVEAHAEHLCPLLADLGFDVTVLTRSSFQPSGVGPKWKGVKLITIWAPRSKGLEAFIHTFFGVIYAAVDRPDVLHIHAVGPAIMALPARILGLKVVVTHHGPDYDRQKWGRFARFVLQLGEFFGMRMSQRRIVISNVIRELVRKKHKVDSDLIPNGVVFPEMPVTSQALKSFGLDAGRYVLLVSRLVPEKRHKDLIQAFQLAGLPDWKLALVGSSDHPDAYVREVKEMAGRTANVVMTGFQTGEALRELYAHAGMFVLSSSHEGLPIAMLEALSYGLPVIASDIPANLEVGLSAEHYFPLGNVSVLSKRLTEFSRIPLENSDREWRREWVRERYDWRDIAVHTGEVYAAVAGRQLPIPRQHTSLRTRTVK